MQLYNEKRHLMVFHAVLRRKDI